MSVRWLKKALANLDTEAEFIAQDSPQAAFQVVSKIYYSVELLKQHPALGRPGRVYGTRELIISGLPYIIPYRIREGVVEILRIFHTSRKWPKKW